MKKLKKWTVLLIVLVITLATVTQWSRSLIDFIDQNSVDVADENEEYRSFEDRNMEYLNSALTEMSLALYYEILHEMGYYEAEIWRELTLYTDLFDTTENTFWGSMGLDFLFTESDAAVLQLLTTEMSFLRGRLSTLSSSYGIRYFTMTSDENEIFSMTGDVNLSNIISSNITENLIDELTQQFYHVIAIRYNAHGRYEIPFLLSPENESVILNYLNRHNQPVAGIGQTNSIPGIIRGGYEFGAQTLLSGGQISWDNPRNTTFIFAIPSNSFDALVFDDVEILANNNLHQTREAELQVRRDVSGSIDLSLMLIGAISLMIPVEKIKTADILFKNFRKLPIEVIAIASVLLLRLLSDQIRMITLHILDAQGFLLSPTVSYHNFRTLYYVTLLALVLTIIAYTVLYFKDLMRAKFKTLNDDSIIFKMIKRHSESELKSILRLKLIMIVTVNALVLASGFIIQTNVFRQNSSPLFLIIFILAYLLFAYGFIVNKTAIVQKDYQKLLDITQEIIENKQDINDLEDLSYFNELKRSIIKISDDIDIAVKRAVTSERMKGELITNVSHDLKTPLTSIISYVDLLQVEGITDDKRGEYLKILSVKTERLKILIEDLFEVSKATSGNLQMDLEEINVVTLMKQTLLGLEDYIETSTLTLRENYPDEDVLLILDGARMHRVFENLVMNIVKYALPNTRAYIDIIKREDEVLITFRNISAHEISDDMLDLSERFVRGETSRTTEGSGLGLAIVKSFVKLQQGDFNIVIDGDLFKVVLIFKDNE